MREHRFHGLEIAIRKFSGAVAVRVVHPAGQVIGEHRHDWPILTIPALGGYDERCAEYELAIGGPAAILHPAGHCHANCIHHRGMETVSIEFDPDWLDCSGFQFAFEKSHCWPGGSVAIQARALARTWTDRNVTESDLQRATGRFLAFALSQPQAARPRWLEQLLPLLDAAEPPSTVGLARQLGLHPAWLARAYRAAAGEGLGETLRRKRVEQAVELLRMTDTPIAEIAVAAGFCDQSHLNRVVRSLAGRTPMDVRAERDQLLQLQA